jgi:hypothetical protein
MRLTWIVCNNGHAFLILTSVDKKQGQSSGGVCALYLALKTQDKEYIT